MNDLIKVCLASCVSQKSASVDLSGKTSCKFVSVC